MLKAGLVDTSSRERHARRNQWSKRFDERNVESTHVGQALEDGEEGANYVPVSVQEQEAERRRATEGLWDINDEEYYNDGGWGLLCSNPLTFRADTLRQRRGTNQQNWAILLIFQGP